MIKFLKLTVKKLLKHYGIRLRIFRIIPSQTRHSSFLEEEISKKYLNQMMPKNSFIVDIGAADGISMSNTYFLYQNGCHGVAIECGSENFAKLSELYRDFPNVNLLKVKVTPDNVRYLLKSCSSPPDFSFLSLDIDGYDYYVLDALLSEYRPLLICAEINETIPPPIRFTVTYDYDYMFAGIHQIGVVSGTSPVWSADHFFGQSISQLYLLCEKYKYDLVELHYNNAFLIPQEINKNSPLTPKEVYDKGYRSRPDRKDKFPWNSDAESILMMSPDKAMEFINRKFHKYEGKYLLEY